MNDSNAKTSHHTLVRQLGLPALATKFRPGVRFTMLAQVVALVAVFNALIGVSVPYAAGSAPIRIVAFGDSLTAGFGVPPADAFPAQLSAALKAKGRAVEIVNAGVSGDTSAAGLARLDWAIPEGTDAVILELGANDALRGIDPALTRKALGEIVNRLKARNIDTLIAGMKAPPNWGADYAAKFDPIFPELASANGLILYPFFLDGVVMQPGLNQPDGLHPTSKGVAEIVKRILPSVDELIARAERRRAPPAKT